MMAIPNDQDKVLEMVIRSKAYAKNIQEAIAAYREEIWEASQADARFRYEGEAERQRKRADGLAETLRKLSATSVEAPHV
jgi:hypothetical protein